LGRAAGIKLYAYVGNTPLNRIDPVGRCDNLSGCAAGSSDQLNMADEPSIWPRHADITDHNRLNNGARRCSPLEVNWLTASSRKRRSRSGQCLPSSNASASMLNYSAHHADQDAKVWLGQPWAAAALLIELPQALVVARSQHYIAPMDTAPPPPRANSATIRVDTQAETRRRIAREAEMIAEARASAAAGRVVSSEEVDAWIDSLDTDHERPAPRSGR
jgi:predicted transcriptional regulator